MSLITTLAEGEARERERAEGEHNGECSQCGSKVRGRNKPRPCRVGMALRAAAVSARNRARAEAAEDAAALLRVMEPLPGMEP